MQPHFEEVERMEHQRRHTAPEAPRNKMRKLDPVVHAKCYAILFPLRMRLVEERNKEERIMQKKTRVRAHVKSEKSEGFYWEMKRFRDLSSPSVLFYLFYSLSRVWGLTLLARA